MYITEQFINKLVGNIVNHRSIPIRPVRFMMGNIGNDDDPNTDLIRDRCSCNQIDIGDYYDSDNE